MGRGVYASVEVADLSQPLANFADDAFDVATVVGVMTYLEPDGCALPELCRVVRQGGLVCFTHRTDKLRMWHDTHERLASEGRWSRVHISEPLPYLPKNPEYGDNIKVVIHIYRVS